MRFGVGFRVRTREVASHVEFSRSPVHNALGVVTRIRVDSIERTLYEVEHSVRTMIEGGPSVNPSRCVYLLEELSLEIEPRPDVILLADLILGWDDEKAKVFADACEEMCQYGAAKMLRGSACFEVRHMIEMLAATTGLKRAFSTSYWSGDWRAGWLPGYESNVGAIGATGATGATGCISVPDLGDVQLVGQDALVRTNWEGFARAPFHGRLVGMSPDSNPEGQEYTLRVQSLEFTRRTYWQDMPVVEGDVVRVTCPGVDSADRQCHYAVPNVTLRIRREPRS